MEQQAKLFDIIFNEDELTWQAMIYKLVREEGMNPWDVDISNLAQKFLDMLKTLKKMDFRVSGKVILAAAILLRLKSRKLVGEDFNNLNRLIAMSEDSDDEFFEGLEDEFMEGIDDSENYVDRSEENFKLNPRTPLPRKRKVSVYDLVDALNKALEVKKRRQNRISQLDDAPIVKAPERTRDITEVITDIYQQIRGYFAEKRSEKMMFSQIVPDDSSKEEKVAAFMPLLYLDNQRRIDIYQEKHLADIEILLNKNFTAPEKVEASEETAN